MGLARSSFFCHDYFYKALEGAFFYTNTMAADNVVLRFDRVSFEYDHRCDEVQKLPSWDRMVRAKALFLSLF